MTLERPLFFRDTPTAYTVVDDLLPKELKKPLDFRTFLCVARKPTVSAAKFNTAPDFPRERRQDRFNQEGLDPNVEGNLACWRYAAIQGVPEVTCPRCQNIFPEGMLICMACGISLATYSDMRRACQVFRMEELAEKLGFEFTLDLLSDDQVAGATRSGNEDRTVRSRAAVLKNHARSYMKSARKDGLTLLQRLGTDAHFAYNCAVQDLTPKCMHWVTVLGNIVLPSVQRTKEEIQTGRTRQFRARICVVAWDPSAPNQKIVVDAQVLVWYKNRFYRANQFAAVYAQFDPRERFPCLPDAKEPFLSQAPTQGLVYQELVDYVAQKIQTIARSKARRKPSPT